MGERVCTEHEYVQNSEREVKYRGSGGQMRNSFLAAGTPKPLIRPQIIQKHTTRSQMSVELSIVSSNP